MPILKNFPVIHSITIFIIPYIFLYSLYIQINGEISPGGGFQAGVIFASAVLAFEVIYGRKLLRKLLPLDTLIILAIVGVIIYASVGLGSLLFDNNYLNYYYLAKNPHLAQEIGICIIELGVGITVASVMCLIYLSFQLVL